MRRARPSRRWPTITFAVPPADYAVLSAIVARDGTRYSTLAREAVQAYLAEVLAPADALDGILPDVVDEDESDLGTEL